MAVPPDAIDALRENIHVTREKSPFRQERTFPFFDFEKGALDREAGHSQVL